MIRFIEDLGIVPNKGMSFENDASLKQGQKMMEYERIYTFFNTNRMRKLENNTYPSKKDNVKTIVETMESIESATRDNSAIVLKNNNTLSINEQKFYKALTEYSTTSKMLEREMAEHKEDDHSLLCEILRKQYESLIDVSTLVENDLDFVQTSSDKMLADDFAKRKHELALHIKKLKKSRGKKCGRKETKGDTDEATAAPAIIIAAIMISIIIFIYQIVYGKNIYIIFLIVVALIYIYLSIYNNNNNNNNK